MSNRWAYAVLGSIMAVREKQAVDGNSKITYSNQQTHEKLSARKPPGYFSFNPAQHLITDGHIYLRSYSNYDNNTNFTNKIKQNKIEQNKILPTTLLSPTTS